MNRKRLYKKIEVELALDGKEQYGPRNLGRYNCRQERGRCKAGHDIYLVSDLFPSFYLIVCQAHLSNFSRWEKYAEKYTEK